MMNSMILAKRTMQMRASSSVMSVMRPAQTLGPMQRCFSSGKQDISEDQFLDEIQQKVKKWRNLATESDLVHPNESPEEIRKSVDLSIPKEGVGLEGILKDVDKFMDHSVRTHHPAFLQTFWSGFNPAAFGGEVISTVTNTSMYTYELAAIGGLIELEICKKMCEMVGEDFKNGSGVLTTGGSNGNMIGMLCARQAKFPDTLREGHKGREMCVFISDETHYSILMAANVLGIGYNNVIKIGVDKNGSMDTNQLRE
jgi:glutamate/tyrosine decarboxylase-like PLP-dependent enzyme